MDKFIVAFMLLIIGAYVFGTCEAAEECKQRKGCPAGQQPRYFVTEHNAICTCELSSPE